ncbi:MAG: NAD-dependent dehydratase, partial [Acidimicrobiia bacterium]
ARAFAIIGESDVGLGEVVNFGSNFEISIGDVVDAVGKAAGKTIDVEIADDRIRPAASEVDRLWASNDKASLLYGWMPEYGGGGGFERGIAETVSWFKDPDNRAMYKPGTYNV